jgi:conjugal transfer pilus assembly protein TraE
MRYALNKSILENALKQRNGYLVIASGLTALCLLLTLIIFQLSFHKRTYLVPPEINHSFWISDAAASSEYLAEMSAFFISLRLNITPSNIKNQREMLLRYTDPSYYGQLKTQLVAEGDRITKESLSTAFYPVDVRIDTKQLQAIVTGDVKTTVGKEPLPDRRVRYLLQYRYNSGRLFVSSFKEIAQE